MTFTNDFSWSFSRAKTLEKCERMYYWAYYGSWGGWNAARHTASWWAYRLKKATSPPLAKGAIVHRVLATAIDSMVPDASYSDPARRIQQETKAMDARSRVLSSEDWRPAKQERFLEDLLIEYGQDPLQRRPETWAETTAIDATAMVNAAIGSPVFKAAMESKAAGRWFTSEKLDTVVIDGVKVYVKLDLGFLSAKGKYCIVDWKTGKQYEESKGQMAVYAMYVGTLTGAPEKDVRTVLAYLDADGGCTIKEVRVTSMDVLNVKCEIDLSVRKMRNLTILGSDNIPKPIECFQKTKNTGKCRWCNYRVLCEGRVEIVEPLKPRERPALQEGAKEEVPW